MFKSCRKKKTPEGTAASGLSWKPLGEPNITFPVHYLPHSTHVEAARSYQNGEFARTSTTNTGTTANVYREEELRTVKIPEAKIADIKANHEAQKLRIVEELKTVHKNAEVKNEQNIQHQRVVEDVNNDGKDYKTEKLQNVSVSTGYVAQVQKNDGVFEVMVRHSAIPAVNVENAESTSTKRSKEEKTVVDANGNHVKEETPETTYLHVEENEVKKSDASMASRGSSASLLSGGSEATRLSNTSMVMTRRKAFRDEEEQNVELVAQTLTPLEEETIKKALHANDFIMAVAPNAIHDIARHMTLAAVRKGDVIMRQGEQGNSMYVSQRGDFKVLMHKQTISKFGKPRLFGELAILYDKPRAATVLATSDGALWQLNRRVFKALLRTSNIAARDNVLAFLRKVPVINAASAQKLRQIADLCEARYYAKDTAIIREGQRGDEFFIVKTGAAVVSKLGMGKIKTLEPGDYFGERALLYDEDKRNATVTAIGYGVECLVLKRNDFHEYLGDVHEFLAAQDEERADVSVSLAPAIVAPNPDRFLPYKDIKLAELLKSKTKILGEGGFGIVHLVKSRGKHFALKEMKKKKVYENKMQQKALNERDIQRSCDSMFIVQLYNTFNDEHNIYLLLEFCPRAELFTLLRKKRFFPESLAKFTAVCVLEALAYLHLRRYAYLDLKPENIFIDKDGYPKVGDFGNAVHLEIGKKTYCFAGTLEYMAPEIIKHTGTDMAADYWAFGVLIYELLLGKSPFMDKKEERLFDNITKGLTPKHFVPNFNKVAKDLIKRLMDVNPAKRLGCLRGGVNGLYRHEWFKDIDLAKLRTKHLKSPLLSLYKK